MFDAHGTLKRHGPRWMLLGVLLGLLAVVSLPVQAQKETILYTFTGGVDGGYPGGGVVLDQAGNLYGTAYEGGAYGVGTVFNLTQSGTLTVLYNFKSDPDGALPNSTLVRDAKTGNLYGTTLNGGGYSCPYSCGTVFELTPSGAETVLYAFQGGAAGNEPVGGLARDAKGNLYGTAELGGAVNSICPNGCGVVFQVTPSGTEKVLYSFTGTGGDGYWPQAGLVRDTKGNLYGTTPYWYSSSGGGSGTVFQITKSGAENILYHFSPGYGTDGAFPYAGLVRDAKTGNLYGTTVYGGAYGHGTVFQLTTSGTETVLYSFCPPQSGCPDGNDPMAGLVRDSKGNLYGTTEFGGTYGFGTVFKITPSGTEKVLHSFGAPADGAFPMVALVRDSKGNLYGTTNMGGLGYGTVFKISAK